MVEVAAGTGYLSKQLQLRKVQVKAIDIQSEYYYNVDTKFYCKVYCYNAISYVKKNRLDIVIMSWPDCDSPFAYNIAKALKSGTTLIYQGESRNGCTGDDAFFDYLESNFVEIETNLNECHYRFTSIYDSWYVFKKL